MLAFLKAPSVPNLTAAGCVSSVRSRRDQYMRPYAGLIQALRVPLALNLQAARTFLAQNQLRLAAMVDMEARHDLAPATARIGWRRPQNPAGALLLLLGLVASGGLVVVLLVSGAGEVAMLGLLVLLAVAG